MDQPIGEWWNKMVANAVRLEELKRKALDTFRELARTLPLVRRLKELGIPYSELKTTSYDPQKDKRPRRLREESFNRGWLPAVNVIVLKDGRRIDIQPLYLRSGSIRVILGIPSTCPSDDARRIVSAYWHKHTSGYVYTLSFVDGRWQYAPRYESNQPTYYAYDMPDGGVEFRTEKPEMPKSIPEEVTSASD